MSRRMVQATHTLVAPSQASIAGGAGGDRRADRARGRLELPAPAAWVEEMSKGSKVSAGDLLHRDFYIHDSGVVSDHIDGGGVLSTSDVGKDTRMCGEKASLIDMELFPSGTRLSFRLDDNTRLLFALLVFKHVDR